MDPLIAAVDPKSFKNAFLQEYRLMLAKQYPNEEPISPAADAINKPPPELTSAYTISPYEALVADYVLCPPTLCR